MIRNLIRVNSLAVILLAAFFCLYPPVRIALDLNDPALRRPGVPKSAWRLFQTLTPRYGAWARERVARGRARNLSTSDVSGTEWPLFGSVFYLRAVENLQAAWEAGDHSVGLEPKVFAKDAIIAASELVIDPNHASWVKKHWGNDYLHRENVFYRMLVMAALSSRAELLQDHSHLDLLRDQVETFVHELDSSKTGLLDDYPGECYPGDVMAAIACVKRADAVLGADHSQFIQRSLLAFTGARATKRQLLPYLANSATGRPASDARGCANSYICLTAPELWPGQARKWYALYDKLFWQERLTAAGYREFAKDVPHSDWTEDVDAGPVVAGYGISACAFGVGAARKNGRFDRAYPLAAEMLAVVWELPNGVLALPRLLSNLSDAPMLGEAAILWQWSVQPEKGFAVKTGGGVPVFAYIVPVAGLLFGVCLVIGAARRFRRTGRPPGPEARAPKLQAAAWALLLAGSAVLFRIGWDGIGLVLLLAAVVLPFLKRPKPPTGFEEWPAANVPNAPAPGTKTGR